jgi:hypothetical protein
VTNKNGKERNKDGFRKEMVVEGATIMKIDKPRGIATMVRRSLIRFKQVF